MSGSGQGFLGYTCALPVKSIAISVSCSSWHASCCSARPTWSRPTSKGTKSCATSSPRASSPAPASRSPRASSSPRLRPPPPRSRGRHAARRRTLFGPQPRRPGRPRRTRRAHPRCRRHTSAPPRAVVDFAAMQCRSKAIAQARQKVAEQLASRSPARAQNAAL